MALWLALGVPFRTLEELKKKKKPLEVNQDYAMGRRERRKKKIGERGNKA